MKELKDYTFEDLVNEAAICAHLALLERGGKGLREAAHTWMQQAILWRFEKERITKNKKALERKTKRRSIK